MKGYDADGITIHRSGPASAGSSPAAGEAWDSRGMTISRTKTDNTDLKQGTCKTVPDARAAEIAKGGW